MITLRLLTTFDTVAPGRVWAMEPPSKGLALGGAEVFGIVIVIKFF